MHRIDIPQWAVERVTAARGRPHVFDRLDPARTALLVVDMQNGFMMEGVAHVLCPAAIDIVPNVNRLAAALRARGGHVFWIQNASTEESRASWSHLHDALLTPEAADRRTRAMAVGSVGHQLWSGLDVWPEDHVVQKTRFSAFIQGSSDLDARLRALDVDSVLVAGTVTGICCESTARDAMMLDYRTVMVTDANAAMSDEEHNASLTSFYVTFGDILATDEVIQALDRGRAPAARRTAGA